MSLDTAGGKAIVRMADRWYLLLRSREWRPVDIGGRERALAPHFSWPVTPIRRSFETFEELIDLVRRLCAGGDVPPDREAPDPWDERLVEIIHTYSGLLDRTFAARGYTEEESLRLAVETLRWLRDIGPVEDEDVPWLLFRLAREAHLDCPGKAAQSEEGTPGQSDGAEIPGEARLRKVLLSLDRRSLQCLAFWGEPQQGHREIAKLLRIPPDDVRKRLAVAAMRLGRRVEELRSPELLEICRALLQGD
jgi:hypothetical protein